VRVFLVAGRYEDALKEAREVQKRKPRLAGGYSLEGDIHLALGSFVDAERMYRQALKLDPGAQLIGIKLHEALSAAGKAREADAWTKDWIARNPKDVSMRLYLGERAVAASNLRAAAAHYEAVLTVDANNVLALNNLAWVGSQLKDSKAVRYAERAVALAPQDPDALDTYGMLLIERKEVDRGLLLIESARNVAPARNDIRLHYAKALLKAGRKTDARKELEALQGVRETFFGREEVTVLLKEL
jgi:tetratricopeptide (TPR) repeat protein